MAVTVVLADGFAGESVEVVAGGRTYRVGPVHTSPLTGMAREVVVDAVPHGPAGATGPDQIRVTARLTRTPVGAPADPDPQPGSGLPAHPGRPSEPAPSAAPAEGTPWNSYQLAEGDVLVLDLVGGHLSGRVMPGPVGFA
jgi:hypothetical protein